MHFKLATEVQEESTITDLTNFDFWKSRDNFGNRLGVLSITSIARDVNNDTIVRGLNNIQGSHVATCCGNCSGDARGGGRGGGSLQADGDCVPRTRITHDLLSVINRLYLYCRSDVLWPDRNSCERQSRSLSNCCNNSRCARNRGSFSDTTQTIRRVLICIFEDD
ncbi:unannotated protein [freshwater metagenome]|uniref:Unannotated protein n=1 Tax=freshwater metagenome TaxID=449393 RepID=A0A6J6QCD9_9ZZZZ